MQAQSQTGQAQTRDDAWHAILHASESLLQAAQAADWDALSGLAAERDMLIRAYFSEPVTVDSAIHVRDKIQQLLAIDDQVLGLARKEQGNLLPAMKAFSQGKKAVGVYKQVGR